MNNNILKHGSLFSGIGGFDLAASWAGIENIFQVEIDEFCQKVLEKNFPDVKRFKDIKEFEGKEYRGRVDIISGGFPCQPFSQAGKRTGAADERALFPEMLRIIGEIKPRWVIAENVYGIINIENGQYFNEMLTSLENKGYKIQSFIIPASAFDAPHRRDRIWVIANTDNKRLQRHREYGECSNECTIGQNHWENPWHEVATRLCRVDDGIPGGLDKTGGISAQSRNKTSAGRTHRLKALGNAIVPQIAYMIFKTIIEIEKYYF